MKTMKLKTFLKELDAETNVAIGAKEGNAFVYIGKAGNMELISICFDNYLNSVTKRLNTYKGYLEKAILTPLELSGDEDVDFEIIRKHAGLIADYSSTVERCDTYKRTYKPALKREVKETYHRDTDNCTVIIIEGLENGQFWFKSEFDKRYNV